MRGAYYKISTMTEEAESKRTGYCICRQPCTGRRLRSKAIWMQGDDCHADSYTADQSESYKELWRRGRILYGDVYDDACAYAMKLAEEEGYTFVHPFDDLDVATGQGSIAMEICEELPDVDYILAPIGGGGLITGVSTLTKMLNPNDQSNRCRTGCRCKHDRGIERKTSGNTCKCQYDR